MKNPRNLVLPSRDFTLNDTPTSWGSNLNIKKDPPKSYFTRYDPKVDMNKIQEFGNDSSRYEEGLLEFERGVDPMKSIQYSNTDGTHSYKATNQQAIRTDVINEFDRLPLSRQPYDPFDINSKKANEKKTYNLDKNISKKTFNRNHTIIDVKTDKTICKKGEAFHTSIGKVASKLNENENLFNLLAGKNRNKREQNLQNVEDLNAALQQDILKELKAVKGQKIETVDDNLPKKLKELDFIERYAEKKREKIQDPNSFINLQNTTVLEDKRKTNFLSKRTVLYSSDASVGSTEIGSKINENEFNIELRTLKEKQSGELQILNPDFVPKEMNEYEMKGIRNKKQIITENEQRLDHDAILENNILFEQLSNKKPLEKEDLSKVNFTRNKDTEYILEKTIISQKSKKENNKRLYESLRTDLEVINKFNDLVVTDQKIAKPTMPKMNENHNIILKKRNSD